MKFILGSIPNGAGTMVLWFLCSLVVAWRRVRAKLRNNNAFSLNSTYIHTNIQP